MLTKEMQDALLEVRAHRDFQPERWVEKRKESILKYVKQYGITKIVMGLSFGIDSAVVYKLLEPLLEQQPWDESILQAYFFTDIGTLTYPPSYEDFVFEQIHSFPVFTELYRSLGWNTVFNKSIIDSELDHQSDIQFYAQQIRSMMIAPLLYTQAVGWQQCGYKAIVTGTANADEFSLGYVGKIGDAAVDIQPLWDLNKFEVREVARFLGVPQWIIDKAPTGDSVYLPTDEEYFGFPYEFLEIKELFKDTKFYSRYLKLRELNKFKFNPDGSFKHAAVVFYD